MARTKQAARKRPIERPPPVRFPKDGFEHPFQAALIEMPEPSRGREHPRSVSDDPSCTAPQSPIPSRWQIVELRMCALSNRIREKPNWWEKMKDLAIVERWREEALQQAGEDDWKLTPGMVDHPSY